MHRLPQRLHVAGWQHGSQRVSLQRRSVVFCGLRARRRRASATGTCCVLTLLMGVPVGRVHRSRRRHLFSVRVSADPHCRSPLPAAATASPCPPQLPPSVSRRLARAQAACSPVPVSLPPPPRPFSDRPTQRVDTYTYDAVREHTKEEPETKSAARARPTPTLQLQAQA